MADTSEFERRLSGALYRLRQAALEQISARRTAEMRVRDLETELRQSRDAVAAARTQPDPEAPLDPAAEVELQSARAEAEALRSQLGALQAQLNQTPPSVHASASADQVSALETQLAEARAEAGSLREYIAARDGGARLGAVQALDTVETLQARVTELESALQGLRKVNAQLRTNNAALREAHLAGLPDEGLVNDGLKAELEALRATRAADRAEIDSVLTALRPLLEGETSDA